METICFDFLADPEQQRRRRERDWMVQAALLRADAHSPKDLTDLRSGFLREQALDNADSRGQGSARILQCRDPVARIGFDTAGREAQQALRGFPVGSARLLLRFRLVTPLLTKDDDAFNLFDNPVRKDRLTGRPFVAAASLKGLAADAYQRAFPGTRSWAGLGGDDPARTHAFRRADAHALRLFGIADDGVQAPDSGSQAGRLHFSPVWFSKVQYLVMNPGDPRQAAGTLPIQFEAIAPEQAGVLEVIYFNPAGMPHGDVATVRGDLARFLAALAVWWPVLGLGAKRLGGYGGIAIDRAELQAVGWPGLEAPAMAAGPQRPTEPSRPAYFDHYLENDAPLSEASFQGRLQQRLAEVDQRVTGLEARRLQQKDKNLRQKIVKELDKVTASRKALESQMRAEYAKVQGVWAEREAWRQACAVFEVEQEVGDAPQDAVIGQRTLTGHDSWMELARWMAVEDDQ